MNLRLDPYFVMFIGAAISVWGVYLQDKDTNEKLDAKSQRIEDLNNFILSSVTGDDSYCYFVVGSFTGSRGILSVIPIGEFPMFDVTARIVDLDEFQKYNGSLSTDNLSVWEKQYTLGNLMSGNSRPLEILDFKGKQEINQNIFISARNGFFVEMHRMRYRKGKWVGAGRILRVKGNTEIIVHEFIDKGYPEQELLNDPDWKVGASPRRGQLYIVP